MKVTIEGKVVKQFGVSLGKAGWESRSGIKVYYGSKEATHTYTNDSLGVEEEYTLTAPWNVRLTPTGEFIHTAQWAYSRIGRYNGSHGCTNMFEADAKWIYDRVLPGDVFKYSGTSKPMETTNGPLALWNIPWSDWQTRSALS
jgi:lipoprotein-anchoring transpeptidase ErfK/SrfK